MHPSLKYLVMNEIFIYFSSLIVSLLLSFFVSIPISTWIAKKIGAIDYPDDLTIHENPTPRLGGLGIVISWIITIGTFMIIFRMYDHRILIVLLGILVIIIIGIIDDIRGIKQLNKFIVELLLTLGITWLIMDIKLWWVLAFVWIFMVGMINAYNFIDGMDGLAGGLAIITYFGLFILFLLDGSLLFSLVSLSCAGACLGFLSHNWHPARIFMGDVGSMSIGFSIGGLSVLYFENGSWALNRIIAVVLIATIPIIDLAFTFLRRIICRKTLNPKKLFLGDRYHYYDQMQKFSKMNTKKIVMISYLIGAIFAILGVTSVFLSGTWSACVGIAGIFLIVLIGRQLKIRIPKTEEI